MYRFRGLLTSLALGVFLSVISCGRQVPSRPDARQLARADSLMEAAHLAHDNDRILMLADSLEAAGDYSRIKADYWRGYSYYSRWNVHLCQQYWYEAISLEIKDREDLLYSTRSANRLSDVMLSKGDFEAAMRVAAPAIDQMRANDLRLSRDYGYLLVTVGCCELNNRNKEQADAYFNEAYDLYMQLLADKGENSGSTHEDNLKTAVAGLTTVARHCLAEKRYADVLIWVERLEQVMEEYKRQPETTPQSIDRRQALALIFKATALEGLGSHEAAAATYDEALTCGFCYTPQGRVESARYLMLARRWNEAAENYSQLDGVVSIFGAGLTLDNIHQYIIPKYRANFNARRNDEALATGIQLCEALDSAIVWNHEDKAAELATLFHTQEIKEEFIKQEAHLERLRFGSAVAVIVLLMVSFLLFVILRHRSSIRLEEAYQELESAHARAQEASRVKTAFLQQITHEIRTPVNQLSGFAQLLTASGLELDQVSRDQINEGVIESTERITGLVNKILDLSDLITRTDLGRGDCERVGHIASEAAENCGIRQVAGIHFDMVASRDVLEQELYTNSQAAVRILSLLLENAIKYTGEGSVTLRIVRKQDLLYFLVEDTGIGVPAQEAEHIFEHFVQLDDYREGTGIGLSLARSLARRLGGDVVLDTSYSFGARFVFSLPLTAE